MLGNISLCRAKVGKKEKKEEKPKTIFEEKF